ncbi:hypothetical protein [Cupriavidus basilensis]|nr:hypothetical protein [Cupriavidus basilensis]
MTVEFVVVHLAQRTLSPAAQRAVAAVEPAAPAGHTRPQRGVAMAAG